MGASGERRAAQYGWENITAKVEEYYGFVIRRLAASDSLPSGFKADVPEAPSRPVQPQGLWASDAAPDAGDPGVTPADEEPVRA
jgi:hypothetical protein